LPPEVTQARQARQDGRGAVGARSRPRGRAVRAPRWRRRGRTRPVARRSCAPSASAGCW
jgi:hypothetical protein